MKTTMKIILILSLSIIAVSSYAGEIREPRDPRGSGGNGGSSSSRPEFSAPGVSATLQLSSAISTDETTEALEKKLTFDPVLSVNTNRGDFKTSFSISLPKSFVSLSSLKFSYNSQNNKNKNYGIGWNISLPMIVKNQAIDSLTPYTEINGGGELTLVNSRHDSIVNHAYSFADQEGIEYDSHEIYKQVVETSFNIYVALKFNNKISGWVTFDSKGQRWVFNSEGLPVGLFNRYTNGIQLIWNEGKLVKVLENNNKWQALLEYSQDKKSLPSYLNGSFILAANFLKKVSVSQNETTHNFFFKYKGQYLSQVLQEDALLPIFQGEYKKLTFEVSKESNDLNSNDKKSLIFSERLDQFQIVEKGDSKNVFYQFVDLNNDGRKDRIKIDYTQINQRINSELTNVQYNIPDTCGRVTPKVSANVISQRINQLNPIITMEIAVWSGKNKTASWEEDRSLELSDKNIKLFNYEVTTKEHIDSKSCYKTHYYHVSPKRNALYFIDINNDGKKDAISCMGVNSLEANNSSNQSPLNLSILKRLGHSDIHKHSFKDVFSSEGSKARIFLQKFDEKRALNTWWARGGEGQAETKKNHLLDHSEWQETNAINFNCHQYTLFNDFNNDGHVDILSGKKLFFTSPNKTYTHNLSDSSLTSLFERGSSYVNLSGNIILVDLNGNGALEPQNARSFTLNPLTGEKLLVKNGTNVIYKNTPNYKLLSYLQSPYEGFVNVDYGIQDGVVVTKSIEKVFNHNQPTHFRTFNYLSAMKDIHRGTFIGFSKTEEVDYTNHENSKGRLIQRKFTKDTSSKALLFKSRGRLNGKPLMIKIWNKEKTKSFQSNYKTYKYITLDNNRIFPFMRNELSVRFLEDNKTYGWSLETITTPEISVRSGKVSFEKEQRGHGLKSPYTDQLLEAVKYSSTKMEIDEDTNISKTLETNWSDKDEKVIRYGKKYKYVDSNLVQECLHKRCKSYEYDEIGRVTEVKNSLGSVSSISYEDDSTLVSSLTADGEITKVTYKNVSNLTKSREMSSGVRFSYDYSVDGINQSITRESEDLGSVVVWSANLPNKKECEEKRHFQCVDNNYSVHSNEVEQNVLVDGFGRTISTAKDSQFNTVFSGRLILDGEGKVLKKYRPSFNRESLTVLSENKYDSVGRITYEKDLLNSTSVYHKYRNGCHSKIVNGATISYECKSSLNNVLDVGNRGEHLSLGTNSTGSIDSISSLGLKWKTNLYGEITSFSTEKDKDGSPLITAQNLHINEQGNVIKDQDGFVWENDDQGRLIKTKRVRQQKRTDVFEELTYAKGNLSTWKSSLKDGSVLDQVSFDYNDLGLVTKASSSFYKLNNSYDSYGRLLETTKEFSNGTELELEISYENGSVSEIEDMLVVSSRSLTGQITKLKYDNGLILKRSFEDNLGLVTSIKALYDRKSVRKERIEYNRFNFVESVSTTSSIRSNIDSSFYEYSKEGRLLIEENALSVERDLHGRVKKLKNKTIKWNSQNLSKFTKSNGESFEFYYDNQGQVLAACPKGFSPRNKSNECAIRIAKDHFLIKGTSVELIRLEDLKVAVKIEDKTYPIQTDYLGSVVAMFSSLDEDEPKILWERTFDTWGNKTVVYNSELDQEKVKRLESLTLWSYAHLISFSDVSKDLYWSQSRVYSASIREWMSVDPMVKWSANGLISQPGNWHSVRYCDNDPVNLVDPSGRVGVFVSTGGAVGIANSPSSNNGHVVEASSGYIIGTQDSSIQGKGFISSGYGSRIVGATAGGGINVGVMFGNVDTIGGKSKGITTVLGPVSVTEIVSLDNKLIGVSVSFWGKGFGLSEFHTETDTSLGSDFKISTSNYTDSGFRFYEQSISGESSKKEININFSF